jgi:SAM-dependent methyltransferase
MEPTPERHFGARQDAYFERADEAHYAWQTEGPYFAATEAALLLAVPPAGRLLELGCGEGGNLYHLAGRAARAFGVDRSLDKLRFARARLQAARFFRADAARLPVRDGAMDAVLIRDLLHHLPDRAAALREAHRALRPGGAITVIEPNGRSPLIWLQGALVAEEREAWGSTGARLSADLRAAGFSDVALERRQPFPAHRVVLHHRYGRPALGRLDGARRIFDGLDALAQRLLPRAAWLYLVARAERG